MIGFQRVSRLLRNLTTPMPTDVHIDVHEVNGEPGLVFLHGNRTWLVMVFEVRHDRIAAIRLVLNPAKLGHVVAPASA